MVNTYRDPLFIQWNKDGQGNKISIEYTGEEYVVAGNRIMLREIPDEFYGVEISGMYELAKNNKNKPIPSSEYFKVDYTIGAVIFHEDLEASTIIIDRYYGRGVIYYPASRIWTKVEGEEVTQTIESIIEAGQGAIEELEQVSEVIQNAEEATANANEIADNFIFIGEYDNEQTYQHRNIVEYEGSSYAALQETIGNLPTNETYWTLVAQKGLDSDMLKSIYDQNDSGVVDDAERLGGELPEYYASDSDLDGHINNRVDLDEVHGIRVIEGQLEYFDGTNWNEVAGSVPQEVLDHLDDMIYDLEVHGIRIQSGVLQYYNTDTENWVSIEAGEGGSGFVWNKNSYTTTEETNLIPIGIAGFNSASHYLTVYQNSTFIEEDQDYQIIDDTHIQKISGDWDSDTLFNFRVIQSIHYDENLDALVKRQEEFTATEDQTLFELTEGAYIVDANALSIFVNGIKQPNSSFVETSSTSFTMNDGLSENDSVIAEWFELVNVSGMLSDVNNKIGILSELETSDTNTLVGAINELNGVANDHSSRHEQGGADEINLAGLEGESAELMSHKAENASNNVHGLGNQRGNLSALEDTETSTTAHLRQISASQNSKASGGISTVIGSRNAESTGSRCVSIGLDGGQNSGANSVLAGSRNTVNTQNNVVVGGFSADAPLTANRKWLLNSENGNIQHSGTISSGHSFTDYAELFPNLTGEPQGAGLLQTIDGYGVRPAQEGEDVIGVTSAMAGVILGDTPFSWQGRWLKDEWGAFITETIIDEETGEEITVSKENPEWNPEIPQESRQERPDQWSVVGLVGQLPVRVTAEVQPMDYIKPWQDGIGQKSEERTSVRVMKITQEYDEQKGYAIAFCFVK